MGPAAERASIELMLEVMRNPRLRCAAAGVFAAVLCAPAMCRAEDFDPDDARAGRVATEVGGAVAGSAAFGAGAFLVALASCGAGGDGGALSRLGCGLAAAASGGIGIAIGVGPGVYWGGNLAGGNGGLGWTVLGQTLGLGAGLGFLVAVDDFSVPTVLLAYLMPVTGAVLGYELSTTAETSAAQATSSSLQVPLFSGRF